jgi:hypothetical protein
VVIVWAPLKEHADELKQRIKESFRFDKPSIHTRAIQQVPMNTMLTTTMDITDLIVKEPVNTIWWVGEIDCATFRVVVPPSVQSGIKGGTITISMERLPIARIDFSVRISGDLPAPFYTDFKPRQFRKVPPIPVKIGGRYWHVSECSRLRTRRAILKVFFDLKSLRAGENWKERLKKEIKTCDVFLPVLVKKCERFCIGSKRNGVVP